MLKEVLEKLAQYSQDNILFLEIENEHYKEDLKLLFPESKNIVNMNYLSISTLSSGTSRIFGEELTSIDENKIVSEENSFDIIYLNNIIHHLPADNKVFEKLKVLLKPGGIVLVVELYRDGNQSDKKQTHILQHHFKAEIDMKMGRSHNFTFKRLEILSYLESCGLVDLDVTDFGDIYKINSENHSEVELVIEGVKRSIKEAEVFDDYKLFQKIGYETLSRIENVGFMMANQLVVTCKFR